MALLEMRENNPPWHLKEFNKNMLDSRNDWPSLFVFKGCCPNLVREIMFLKWKEGSRAEGSLGDTIGDDHAIDAAEYVVSYVSKGPLYGYRERAPSSFKQVNNLTGY
jgi:hypothetical protein